MQIIPKLSSMEERRIDNGVDFDTYKLASVMRRIEKRMQNRHMESATDYLEYLKSMPTK